uniref:RING-type domain-containing protein n=2 Tax=Amphimedon queenslandica TaxID=400682 RepID=A0A1X7UW25_AMPQE
MATKPSSSSSPGLLKLEEQLTCPVCLDHYTNPKTLPCLHSFCEHCLEGLPLDKKNETYYLSCPTCRHCTGLPEEGAGAFPVAFTLNNLKEIYSLMKKVADPQQVTCDNCATANSTVYCKDCIKFMCSDCISMHKKWSDFSNHQLTSLDEVTASDVSSTSQLLAPAKQEVPLICPIQSHDEPLKIYCETCDSVICRDCTVRTHKDHEYDLVSASYTKHYQELEGSLNPVKGKIEGLKKVLSALAEREGEIRERGEGVLEEIHEMVEDMINVLRQSERKLTEQAKRVTDAKLKVLSEQVKLAEISLSVLEDVEDYVEQSLKTGSPQQVLRSKKQMMERMSEVTAGINVEELHPKEKADFVLSKDIKSLHHIGNVVLLQQCRVKKIDCISPAGKVVSFSLSMEAPDSSVFEGSANGQFQSPHDLAVDSRGLVYVADYGNHRIQKFSSDGKFVGQFGTKGSGPGQLNGPMGITIDTAASGLVYISEWGNHRISVFTSNGVFVSKFGSKGSNIDQFMRPNKLSFDKDGFLYDPEDKHGWNRIASVGEEGNGPLQFNTPYGIAISPITGQVYVADKSNHPDLTFSHSFGSEGSANGQFSYPKFSSDGQFLDKLGIRGSGPGQLIGPHGIAIDTGASGLVYVVEWANNCISVFTNKGVFVNSFGSKGSNIDQFNAPYGLAFDKDGFLYVCDYILRQSMLRIA